MLRVNLMTTIRTENNRDKEKDLDSSNCFYLELTARFSTHQLLEQVWPCLAPWVDLHSDFWWKICVVALRRGTETLWALCFFVSWSEC